MSALKVLTSEEVKGLTIEQINEAIASSLKFQSMNVDGEQIVNSNIGTLMRAREQLLKEQASKTRATFATFDLSKQNF